MRNWGQLFLMMGLVALIVMEVVGLTGEPEIDFVPAIPSDSSVQNFDFKPMSSPPQLTTRPLFRQTRRPPDAPVQDETPSIEQASSVPSVLQTLSEQVPAVPSVLQPPSERVPTIPSVLQTYSEQVPTPRHQLTAVVIMGNEAVAYLIDPVNLDLIRLSKGDQIDGWTLHEVFPDAVVLGYGPQQQARLELWADERKEEDSVHLNEDQDTQDDFDRPQGELSAPESLPAELPGRPVRGPRSRVR